MFNIFLGAFLGAVSGVAFACWGIMKVVKYTFKEHEEEQKRKHIFVYEF